MISQTIIALALFGAVTLFVLREPVARACLRLGLLIAWTLSDWEARAKEQKQRPREIEEAAHKASLSPRLDFRV